MKKLAYLANSLTSVSLLFCALVFSGGLALPASAQSLQGYTLVWSDDFNLPNGSPPDPTKWGYDIGNGCPNLCGWGNDELEYYTSQLENAEIENHQLVIQANQESYEGFNYTSAKLETLLGSNPGAWTYGIFEASIKIPYGQGMWPAFWLLGTNGSSVGWPACGEIDIMENIGAEPDWVHGTIHGDESDQCATCQDATYFPNCTYDYNCTSGVSASNSLPDNVAFSDDFHTYAVAWGPNQVQWFVDGQLYFTATPASLPPNSTWELTGPESIILNLAVGGTWPGNPDDTTFFPQLMFVDWVRVYQQTLYYWSGIYPTNGGVVIYSSTNVPSNTVWVWTTNLFVPLWVPPRYAVPTTYGSLTAITVTNTSAAGFFRLISVPTNTPDGMAFIPQGAFTIGNSIGDSDITDANPTNVLLSPFYMDTNLVSYCLWQTVYAYATSNGYAFDPGAGSGQGTNYPVETVDWYDAVKWCNARSQLAGLTPVYYTDTNLTQVYTNGDTDAVYANWMANGYRLPTEAEWEKAARGGLGGQRFPWGLAISESQANYYGDTNDYSYDLGPDGYNANFDDGDNGNYPYTSPVGYFAPNGYGLNDMAGNVEEWCWDWYAPPPYPTGSPYSGGTDPRGPAASPYDGRVLRGGDWGSYAGSARCAYRGDVNPGYAADGFGFRCVRVLYGS